MLECITPVILTYNEEKNIGRTLNRLTWAKRIIVVDSFSDDATESIVRKYPNVVFVQHPFETHGLQWNYAISRPEITTEWVLALDADFVLSDEIISEIKNLDPEPGIHGYKAAFRFLIYGKPLKRSLYPPLTILYRLAGARYIDDGHSQKVHIRGEIRHLSCRVDMDDRKDLKQWIWSQQRYAKLEAEKLRKTPWSELSLQDRVRKTIFLGPPAVLVYCLIVQGLIFNGREGIFYTMQRFIAEALLSLYLMLFELGEGNDDSN